MNCHPRSREQNSKRRDDADGGRVLDIRYFGTHKTGTRLGQSATFTFPDCRSRPGPSPAPPPRCQFYLWIAAWPALLSKSKLIVSDLGRGTELDDRVKTANVASDLSYDDQAPADGSTATTASSMNVTPHVAQNTSGRSSAIDGRTTRHGGYAVSQRIRSESRRHSAGSRPSPDKRSPGSVAVIASDGPLPSLPPPQSGAANQTDSGGRLMAKVPGFAKVYAGRWAHRRNGHQATFANAAGFFNNLLAESRGSDDPGFICVMKHDAHPQRLATAATWTRLHPWLWQPALPRPGLRRRAPRKAPCSSARRLPWRGSTS